MTAISETTRVLLVEDNPGDADLFRGGLSNAAFGRFEIDTVGRLSDATLRTAAGDVDVVVLDLSLPDSFGIQTMREMRKAAPRTAIVVLTGENDERLGLEALNEGAQDYLVKGDSSGRTIARTLLFAIERRLLQEQLHRREALLAEAQQIARLGSFEWDIPGDRMTWSDELCAVYCVAAKDIEPSFAGFLERVRPDDRELVHDLFQSARNGQISVLDVEYRTLGPGNTLILHCRGHVLTNGAGRPSSIVAICQDITERRKLEGALLLAGRMSSVGTMALGIAHEINNPLSYLLSNLEHIDREVKELATRSPSGQMRDLTDAVEQARHGADRVRRVVKGLKAFSRTGNQESRVLLDLQPVLDGAITLTSNEIRHRARLVKDYGPTPQVDADEARLAQVFVNLLINAAQAIGDGPAKDNEIHVVTSTDKAGRAVVEIRDTGCGVPAANRAQIFDPFFTTKTIGQGTGLGLSIIHGIVAGYGGEITFESSGTGRGTTFRVVLPAGGPDVPRATIPPVQTVPAGRRGRVLVVDDEPMVASVLRRILARDHDVFTAGSGQEAMARLDGGERFDAILCDLMMPVMSGMELFQHLSTSMPELVERMVFISGGAFTPDAKAFLERVPNARIDKPFQSMNVRALVRGLVRE